MYLEEASSALPNPEDLEASGLWNRVHSWSFLPSSLGSPLGKMACHAGPANLFGTSPPGHCEGSGGRSSTLERGARPASGRGVLHITHWESGVSLPPVQPEPKRASAVSLGPSRLGRLESAPALVAAAAAAAAAGGRGERGARAEEAWATRTGRGRDGGSEKEERAEAEEAQQRGDALGEHGLAAAAAGDRTR